MNTVRRLLYRDIISSVVFVVLALLSLFYFIDFVAEIDRMARVGAGAGAAALVTLMMTPQHFYELFPIAVLIGTIFSLARMAQSSEFTILRTGGLGPDRALGLLASLALVFAVITFVVGDYVGPYFERQGDQLTATFSGKAGQEAKGAWLKDREMVQGQERSFSIHVGQANTTGQLSDVQIYEFDLRGRLVSRIQAAKASVNAQGLWHLSDVQQSDWQVPGADDNDAALREQPLVRDTKQATLDWPSTLTANVIAAAVLPPESMSTLELYRYIQHLSGQEQSAQAHELQFWRKALYPFACFVMMALALPFAYLHARSGGISLKVFGGIMLGISFVLLNDVAGHIGLLKGWTPWAVAGAPSAAYLALSLAAFGWLVRYR